MLADLLTGTTIGLHLVSAHLPAQSWENDFNPGVYVKTADGWTAGAYYNTLRRSSVDAGYTIQHGIFGLTAGAISGYEARRVRVCDYSDTRNCTPIRGYGHGPLVPLWSLCATLPPVDDVTPRLSFMPGVGAAKSSVLHLSVARRF